MPVPQKTLANGVKMPQLGFGVWQVESGDEVENAVSAALAAGYRHIDTAAAYGNEPGVGKAIKASGIPREEIFITTKLWNSDQGYDSALKAYEESLKKLDTGYVDLYLIHWWKGKSSIESWRALEKLYAEGKMKAIGVSNFQIDHLDKLAETAKVTPMVNQVELHPKMTQLPLREYNIKHHIQTESWSPLMQGGDLLKDETITSIAEVHGKNAGQIILRWHIQNDLVVIPKSVTPERIKSNFDIFDFKLSDDEMKSIDNLNEDKRVGPSPDYVNF